MPHAEPHDVVDQCHVSIGVTTLNEARTIGRVLETLVAEARSVGAELIVVAGGTDGTVEIVKGVLEKVESSTLIVEEKPSGKPAALNNLVSSARGEIVVLTDGDVLVSPGSISLLINAFRNPTVGCACARVVGAPGEYNLVEQVCDWTAEIMSAGRRASYSQNGTVDLASGNLLAVRRSLFPVLPLDTMADDGYISAWVRHSGYKIAYVENAIVQTRYARTLTDYLHQKSRTRLGHIQVERTFPDSAPRTAPNEFIEYFRTSRAVESRNYGLGIFAASIMMAGFAWLVAYSSSMVHRSGGRRGWRPIESTKTH